MYDNDTALTNVVAQDRELISDTLYAIVDREGIDIGNYGANLVVECFQCVFECAVKSIEDGH